MSEPIALIVDDEPDIRELLEITLTRMQVRTVSVGTLGEAIEQLDRRHFDLCLADMRLPDGDGIDIVRRVNHCCPDTPIAVITAHGNMQTAIDALKAGAFDFVSKPVDLPVLRRLVGTALQLRRPPAPPRPSATPDPTAEMLGRSDAIAQIRRLIGKLSRNQAPVFISGESGTGKELAARLIHRLSPRGGAPFIAINCGAVPQDLMESEFFGHVKGSFTGAVNAKDGLFKAAQGGTLFLDEVADLPLAMQVKLLRAVQEKSVRPIGAPREEAVDVRLISASHKDLAGMVEKGDFRQDLYYRLHVIELHMPPLRARREDIPGLIDHMLARIAGGADARPRMARAARRALYEYPFPGNVRELENILERATALCEANMIERDDLGLIQPAGALSPGTDLQDGLESYMAGIERQVIIDALEATRWNKTAAARKLGISFRALRYRLEKLALDGGGNEPDAG